MKVLFLAAALAAFAFRTGPVGPAGDAPGPRAVAAKPGDWAIAMGYSVKFSTSGEVGGIFRTLNGTIHFDESNLSTASFNMTVDVASINTGNAMMNQHAKGPEWFDAGKFPKIAFVSSAVTQTATGYQVTGTLGLHGVSRQITIPFTFQATATGAVFHAVFTIDRTLFDLGKPGDIDNNISIELTVPVVGK